MSKMIKALMVEYLLVMTVQRPVNRWTAPFTITDSVGIGTVGFLSDVEKAYGYMLDKAIAEGIEAAPDEWTGTEREDVIVLHWSATPIFPMAVDGD